MALAHRLAAPAALAAAAAGGCAAIWFADPTTPGGVLPVCPTKALLGIDCPGCGGLRATHAFTKGNIAGAFRFHPGFVLSLPIIGYLIVLWIREWRRTGEMPVPLTQPECNRPLVWIAMLFISLGIVRNIPVKPFTWLTAPPVEVMNADSN